MGQTTALTLEPRQEQSIMEITAAEIGEEQNVVHLEANMGAYGKVYATIIFKFNAQYKNSYFQDIMVRCFKSFKNQ